MKRIATLTKKNHCYEDQLQLLYLKANICIQPRTKGNNDNSPDFDVMLDDYHFGAAWKKQAKETNREYLSAKIDDPSLIAPVCDKTFDETSNTTILLWEQP